MPEPYSNRELDEKFGDIKESLNRIEAQTTKTNGSVANLKLWRAYLTGAVTIIAFLLASVGIPLISSYIQTGKL
jgi:hypothetical protein